MVYSVISSMRIPYDIDGTVVYAKASENSDVNNITNASVLNSASKIALNDENNTVVAKAGSGTSAVVWFLFPEPMVINRVFGQLECGGYSGNTIVSISGSNNTTNGMEGTWENATFPEGIQTMEPYMGITWRTNHKAVVFTQAITCIKIVMKNDIYSGVPLVAVHLYGSKATGETPEDLVFCETDGTEITAVNDFQDRPEASTAYDSFKIRNVSPDKTATNVNVNVTHTDFLLSLSENGPWTAGVDFASLSPDTLTDTIYIKNELGQPPLTLGPKAAKVIATVGSWT